MYRFLDSWVVERTLFEFVNQGGCSCCGMSHGGMRAQDLMALCTDYESGEGRKEARSPWPDVMRDEIWSERVRFRRELKERLPVYRERFPHERARRRGSSGSSASSSASSGAARRAPAPQREPAPSFCDWFRGLDAAVKRQCFQMPREELHVLVNTTYAFKPSYQVVMCAVVEQLTHFDDTGYADDGASEAEVTFEECLQLERGAFVLLPDYYLTGDGLDMLFARFQELGGPSLLPKRGADRVAAANDARAAAEAAGDDPDVAPDGTQSFRSDRRLIRLAIARYFADQCWRRYDRMVLQPAAAAAAAASVGGGDAKPASGGGEGKPSAPVQAKPASDAPQPQQPPRGERAAPA